MIQCIIVVMNAVNHTRDMVNKMRKMGINILSYFISDYDSDRTLQDFKTMYGSDSENINVSSLLRSSNNEQYVFNKMTDKQIIEQTKDWLWELTEPRDEFSGFVFVLS